MAAGNILRQHYQRPYFLPPSAESSKTDWIFMGSPGYGAHLHVSTEEVYACRKSLLYYMRVQFNYLLFKISNSSCFFLSLRVREVVKNSAKVITEFVSILKNP